MLSAGRLEYPPEGFASNWDYHRRPNAFGLFIASDPYKYELVAEIGTTRGGDGGCTICGGTGFFVGWLTWPPPISKDIPASTIRRSRCAAGYTVARRVLDLR